MNFEELMQAGQQAHLGGEYSTAFLLRFDAYAGASNPIDLGRAARDIAASLDRVEEPGDTQSPAVAWAEEAYALHDAAFQAESETQTGPKLALRERAASATYVGSLALRSAIHQEQAGEDNQDQAGRATDYLTRGLEDISAHEAKQHGVIDQYRINMTGRVALGEALYGNRAWALKFGFKAIGLAAISESAAVTPFNLAMPMRERLKARTNAALRGVGALATTLLSFRPTRSAALRLADRIL